MQTVKTTNKPLSIHDCCVVQGVGMSALETDSVGNPTLMTQILGTLLKTGNAMYINELAQHTGLKATRISDTITKFVKATPGVLERTKVPAVRNLLIDLTPHGREVALGMCKFYSKRTKPTGKAVLRFGDQTAKELREKAEKMGLNVTIVYRGD